MPVDLKQADLVVFMTEGVSLAELSSRGMLEREIALYKELQPELKSITFVTYGGGRDMKIAGKLGGVRVIANSWGLPGFLYQRQVAAKLSKMTGPRTIIKSNQTSGAPAAMKAARKIGAKFIARSGYWLFDFVRRKGGDDSKKMMACAAMEKDVFTGADHVVVSTEQTKEGVIKKYYLDTKKVTVIPNYVDTELFRPNPALPKRARQILYIGRLSKQKNLHMLLSAVQKARCKLLMIGTGAMRKELEDRIKADKIDAEILGSRDHQDLPSYINSCEAFVLPSLYEGHPKTLIEAMACGACVIGTKAPGIQEVIEDGHTGYLAELTPDALAAAIKASLSDLELSQKMGQNARAFAESHYALSRIVEKELAVYEGVLNA